VATLIASDTEGRAPQEYWGFVAATILPADVAAPTKAGLNACTVEGWPGGGPFAVLQSCV